MPQDQERFLKGTHHAQYLLICGGFSSWAHGGYKGSIHRDPNYLASPAQGFSSNIRHFIFQSEAIMDEVNRVGIKKVVSGDNHVFILLNDGSAYGSGWNEYCQLLTNKIAPKSNVRDQLVKADIDHVEDIYPGANFTYCLIRGASGLEMYSAGWNNECCCAQGSDTFRKLGRVYYWNGTTKDVFPPPSDTILDVKCGGSNVAILTVNNIENRCYLYFAGTFEHLQSSSTQQFLNRKELPNGLHFCRLSLTGNSATIYLHTENSTYNVKGIPENEQFDQLNRRYGINRSDGKLVSIEGEDPIIDNTFKSFTLRNKVMALAKDGKIYMERSDDDDLHQVEFTHLLSESDQFKYENDHSVFDVTIAAGEEIGLIFIKRAGEKGKALKEKLLNQVVSGFDNPFTDCTLKIGNCH